MKEKTQATAIVPSAEATAELIPGQTAELIAKSFAENTMRNRKQALRAFAKWLRNREITGCSLNISRTYLARAKHQERRHCSGSGEVAA